MAEMQGHEGAVFYRRGYYAADASSALTFVASSAGNPVITGSGFTAAGLTYSASSAAANWIEIASTSAGANDGVFTITAATSSKLTLHTSDSIAAKASSTSAKINGRPGKQLAGFFNWTVDQTGEALDATDFGDSGNRTYIGGLKGWTGTAERHYMTSSAIVYSSGASSGDWVGSTFNMRFFLDYQASPSVTQAVYLEGSAVVTGLGRNVATDAIEGETLNFQGTGSLSVVTRTSAWHNN